MTIDLGFAWTDAARPARPVAFVDVPGPRAVRAHHAGRRRPGAGGAARGRRRRGLDAAVGRAPRRARTRSACAHGLLVVTRSDLMDPEPGPRTRPASTGGHAAGRHPGGRRLGAPPAPAWTSCGPRSASSPPRLPAPDAGRRRAAVGRPGVHHPRARHRGHRHAGRGPAPGRRRAGARRAPPAPAGRVRGLQCLGAPRRGGARGRRVAVNLRGLPREAVARGDVLLTPGAWLDHRPARRPAARRRAAGRRTPRGCPSS